MPLNSVNPATGEVLAAYNELTPPEIEQKLSLAASVFKSWRLTSFSERSKLMNQAARLFKQDELALAKLMAMEMGKPITAGLAEVRKCALTMEYYAANAEK